ncbi:MAG: sigma-70 family RNA polymerase sigma factor [Clostridiales bacterium]|nr:sigma-70 family RNA polymerase sigma factor [Clostridiales bacterium]
MEELERLIREYGKDIYSFCFYLTGNRELADDLYQQTFLVAIEKGEIDSGLNPKSYLLSVAVNIRNNQRRRSLFRLKKTVTSSDEDYDLIENMSDGRPSAEEEIIRNERNTKIRTEVGKLPEKLRQVVIMFYTEDLSITEISKVLKISEGTVKSRLHNAKKKLKERLIDYETN